MIPLVLLLSLPFLHPAAQADTAGGYDAPADTTGGHDVKDLKMYGNCLTATGIDLFTDQQRYLVLCGEETTFDKTEITIASAGGRLVVSLSKGVQFQIGHVPVLIRVDKGDLIRRSAEWGRNSESAIIRDHDLALRLLHDLARGQRVIIQVGEESGTIRLDGSRPAIDDFRVRAGLNPQRSLTIPRQQTLTPEQRQRSKP